MSFLTAGMLKFLKRSGLKYIYFTLVCLLMLSLWIFPQHSWSSFRPSSPDFKGAFMFSWRIVLVNGNEWLKSRCWMLSYIDKLHKIGTWMNSQPSLQMPSWYLLYQYDFIYPPLWGKAPKRTREQREFCWFLCLGAALALFRELGSWAKCCGVLVSDLEDKPTHGGSPCRGGAASPQNYLVPVSWINHHLCALLCTFRTELQLMRSTKMEFDILRLMLKSKINIQLQVYPETAGIGSTGHGGTFWQLLTEASHNQALDMQTQRRVLKLTWFLLVL